MWKFILGLSILVSAHGFADEIIPYKDIRPVLKKEYDVKGKGYRTQWKETKQFCYIGSGKSKEECLPIYDVEDIKVKENGGWSKALLNGYYIDHLSTKTREDIEKYYKVFVRYLALKNSNEFVIHVNFSETNTKNTRTLFVSGEIINVAGEARLKINSFSVSSDWERVGLELLVVKERASDDELLRLESSQGYSAALSSVATKHFGALARAAAEVAFAQMMKPPTQGSYPKP